VWDPLVRVLHWTLVASVLGAWLTAEIERDAARRVHEWLGYAALAVIAVRFVWGWVGSRYARFADFVPGPVKTIAYARAVLSRTEPRYLGHNPLGGWMVVALLVMVAAAGLTGWLSVTDRFWGVEWMQELHEAMANTLLVLAGFHVAGVIYTSVHHRENLVRAMFTGRKRAT
jgi:cytochrome b